MEENLGWSRGKAKVGIDALDNIVVVVVLLGNPTGLSWPNNRDSEIFLQLLPESVQRRS